MYNNLPTNCQPTSLDNFSSGTDFTWLNRSNPLDNGLLNYSQNLHDKNSNLINAHCLKGENYYKVDNGGGKFSFINIKSPMAPTSS